MVVNESMWKLLGNHARLGVYDEAIYGTIIGVVKDYHSRTSASRCSRW